MTRLSPVRAAWLAGIAIFVAIACPSLALNSNHQITQYVHRIWQAQPGLSQTSIYSLTQTRDGYIWLGTQSGVVRFDGNRFSPVEALQQASLGDIWARAIEEDTAGHVWISANDLSLLRLGKDGVKVFTEKDGLPTAEFSCLVPGPDGEMWSCAPAGLARFRGDKADFFPFPQALTSRPTAGCRSSDGKIWTGAGSTLFSWDGSSFTRFTLRSVEGDATIRPLLCAGRDVWIGTMGGLVRLRDGRETLYTANDGLADDGVLSLAPGQDGVIWVGTRNGFSRLRNGNFESYGYRDGLSQNAVFAMSEDWEGSLWVATKNGLNQFLDGAATRYSQNEGLPSEDMGPVFEDRRGTLWAGTLDSGLARFDGHRFTPVPTLASGSISTLTESSDGALWAGTGQGLKRLVNGRVEATFGVEQGLPDARIRALFRDRAGVLWVGTAKGAAKLQNGRFAVPPGLGDELAAPIVAIGQTRDGAMLFAEERGSVFVLKDGALTRLISNDEPSAPSVVSSQVQGVNAIYTDPDGVVWMGTDGGGLTIWRNGKLTRFLVRHGLFDNEIYGFVPDTADRLWMACSNGFFSVSRAEIFKFADGKVHKIVSAPYSPLDGLRTVQGTPGVQPVGTRTRDGRVWFSSSVWLLAFAPDQGTRRILPPVTVESVTVNGSTFAPEKVQSFEPGAESLAFRYTALSYLAPQRLTFKYLLEGYDKTWTEAGTRREAFYNNLPPGKFRFRVAACGGIVPCNEAAVPLKFEILPEFYQRIWFIPLCVGLLGLVAWMTYEMRVRKLREHFVLILAERSRIARELHDTLIQGFSGITMQLHAFAGRLRSPQEQQVLEEIIGEAGVCLRETRRSVAGLRAGAGSSSGLAEAIAESARHLTQERHLRLKLALDDIHQELPAEVKYNLLCIAQEAITNCIKHANARVVEVALSYAGGELRLSIRDDGRGIARGPAKGSDDGGHYGLVGMRERATQMGGEFAVSSQPGVGTTITVRVPLVKENPLPTPPARIEVVQ